MDPVTFLYAIQVIQWDFKNLDSDYWTFSKQGLITAVFISLAEIQLGMGNFLNKS